MNGSVLTLRLDAFVGPFDLLWDLIERRELSLADLPVAEVADQFLSYVVSAQWPDLETAAGFLVMAARLVRLKMSLLLPSGDGAAPGAQAPAGTDAHGADAEDGDELEVCTGRTWATREELVTRLTEYREFRRVAEELRMTLEAWRTCYPRPPRTTGGELTPGGIPAAETEPYLRLGTGGALAEAFAVALRRGAGPDNRGARRRIRRGVAGAEVLDGFPREDLDVRATMAELEAMLEACEGALSFSGYARLKASRSDVVAAFLGVLELVRMRRIRLVQVEPFGDMELYRVSSAGQGGLGS